MRLFHLAISSVLLMSVVTLCEAQGMRIASVPKQQMTPVADDQTNACGSVTPTPGGTKWLPTWPSHIWSTVCASLLSTASDTDRQAAIDKELNAFWQTDSLSSYFDQIKSIYNGASASATLSADITTLNFRNGMQVSATANAQAGSSGTSPVSTGNIPTLAATAAAQAAQNELYGGTVLGSILYPLYAVGRSGLSTNPGQFGLLVAATGREGVDIQDFKSGTSVTTTAPPTHGSAQIEGYMQYNAINMDSTGKTFAGALFLGGSYGYDHISHGYARDYGFGGNTDHAMGQISGGVLVSGAVRVTISRAFGPSQTYFDSTSNALTKVNNFKAWSIGINYQAQPKGN